MTYGIGYKNRVRKGALAILTASIAAREEMTIHAAVTRADELEQELDKRFPQEARNAR